MNFNEHLSHRREAIYHSCNIANDSRARVLLVEYGFDCRGGLRELACVIFRIALVRVSVSLCHYFCMYSFQ